MQERTEIHTEQSEYQKSEYIYNQYLYGIWQVELFRVTNRIALKTWPLNTT